MPRQCTNSPDLFCYICGQFTTTDQKLAITALVKRCYLAYFGCKLGDQDKPWAPHVVCKRCSEHLRQWYKRERKSMPFGVPMIWREPTNHVTDCYFCMTKVRGFSKKNKHKIAYPLPPSAMRPVPHSDGIPVPDPPATLHKSESSSESSQSHSYHDDEYTCSDEHDISPSYCHKKSWII